MSVEGDINDITELSDNDHQTAYIYKSRSREELTQRFPKRRKLTRKSNSAIAQLQRDQHGESQGFEPLLNGAESPQCAAVRQQLFTRCWAVTEDRIEHILNESNEDTLAEVVSFVHKEVPVQNCGKIPAGFIVTGPNIASQAHLFEQLSTKLKAEDLGPLVTLRSGDASNLKSILRKLINDATNRHDIEEEGDGQISQQDGRKYLNYDLEIVHNHIQAHNYQRIVISLQDSEAFDPALVADLIILLRSWRDRIPSVLLFGIATSVTIFHERLSRAASRCIYGSYFEVEQISSILEALFLRTIASHDAPFRLGSNLVASLVERQYEHVQSVQAFAAALKYAYMCHFYANALTIMLAGPQNTDIEELSDILQPEHYAAVRILPSFRRRVETLIAGGEVDRAQRLLEDNDSLWYEIRTALDTKDEFIAKSLRVMQILHVVMKAQSDIYALYARASTGTSVESELIEDLGNMIKKSTPEGLISLANAILSSAEEGSSELRLESWNFLDDEREFVQEIEGIQRETQAIIEKAGGETVKSRYNMHSKAAQTAIVGQKVQLSQKAASLTGFGKAFTKLIDRMVRAFGAFIVYDNPQEMFLSEVWLYDSRTPYRDVFTTRPRAALERALSRPHDYLGCRCCDPSVEGAFVSHPPTAILYEMYLSAGSLINVSDLLTAFLGSVSGEDGEGVDEREGLMLFYRALSDFKFLGMIKQSRKKQDHLMKLAWKGL